MAVSETRQEILPEDKQLRLAKVLQQNGLFEVKEDPAEFFRLKSGRMAPHYLDLRQGISSPLVLKVIANTFGDLMEAKARSEHSKAPFLGIHDLYDHIVGTPEAVTSYAAVTATRYAMSLLQPRVNLDKSAGNKTPILGKYKAGAKVAALDDVISDGESKIDTINGLAELDIEVADYFVIVDREEGGAAKVMESTGIAVTPAIYLSSMVKMLHEDNRLNATQFDNVAEYMGQYGDQAAKETLGVAG